MQWIKENIVEADELALTYHTVNYNLSYNGIDCTINLFVNSGTPTTIHVVRTKMEILSYKRVAPICYRKCNR